MIQRCAVYNIITRCVYRIGTVFPFASRKRSVETRLRKCTRTRHDRKYKFHQFCSDKTEESAPPQEQRHSNAVDSRLGRERKRATAEPKFEQTL